MLFLRTTAPPSFLAGIDDILNKCYEHCIRQFILHSQHGFVHGGQYILILHILKSQVKSVGSVSGLLVTGRPGTGKTSIVRTVARNLQEDYRTHTCAPLPPQHTQSD
jgi:peroxin-1